MNLSVPATYRVFLGALVAILALASGSAPSDGSGTGTSGAACGMITIGDFAALTGTEPSFGRSSHEGALLNVEETDKAGGPLGKSIDRVTEDNRSTAG